MTERLEAFLAEAADGVGRRAAEMWRSNTERALAHCESPIEKLMLVGMLEQASVRGLSNLPGSLSDLWVVGRGHDLSQTPELDGVWLCSQAIVGRYRVDFLIRWVEASTGTDVRLVVECDGHDFHEKTAKQAQRDKSRDRDMLLNHACHVMRFTGSEIHRDPSKCAADALGFIIERIENSLLVSGN